MAAFTLRNWVKKLGEKLQGGNSRRSRRLRSGAANRQEAAKCRPSFETLEDRLTPSTINMISFNNTTYATLQAGINAAESSGLANPTITVSGSCVGGVTVGAFSNGTSGTLEITGAYGATITAPSVANAQSSLISVTGGVSVELKGLDFTGASASPNLDYGVYASGSGTSVNVNNSTIQNIGNTGSQTGSVYGVYATTGAELTMASSTVTSIADETGSFGGVGVEIGAGSSATLQYDTITSYQADGMVVTGASASATISSTTVTGINNHASNQTGILISSGATADIDSTSVTANSLAGISASGASSVTVTNDVIESNDRGLVNSGSTITGANDTISGNAGGSGAGVYNLGTMTLSNSTITGNSSDVSGGGIFNSGGSVLTLSNNTITGNTASSGGGIQNVGSMTLSNNTVSGNVGGNIANYGTETPVTDSVKIGATTYATLQAAINAASGSNPVITITGPTVGGVTVPSGGFTGTLTITSGVGGTITAPTVADAQSSLISVTTDVAVELTGLTITGAGTNGGSVPNLTYGVYGFGSGTSLSILNSVIENIGNSSQTTSDCGIYVANQASLTLTNSTVTNIAVSTATFGGTAVQIGDYTLDGGATTGGAAQVGFATLQNDTINGYQDVGVFVTGFNGSTPSSATISNCTITGLGAVPYGYGASGIEIYDFGAATIENSIITGNHDSAPPYQAVGILVYQNPNSLSVAGSNPSGATVAPTTGTTVLDSVVSDSDIDMENYAGPVPVTCSGDTFNGGDDPYYTNTNYDIGFGICDPGGGGTGYADLTVSNSYVSGCQSGIYTQGEECTVTGTTVCNNVPLPSNAPFSNAGIWNQGAGGSYGVVLSNDLIYGNTSSNGGGGYASSYGSYTTITDSQITNNSTDNRGGGGIEAWGGGYLTVSDSTIANNTAPLGGGVYNRLTSGTAPYGTMTITLINSTISGNSATASGGGVFNYGTTTLINSTVSGNSAANSGGGIYNQNNLTLSNTTVFGNSANNGGGLLNHATLTTGSGYVYPTGTLTLSNSIVAGDTASTDQDINNSGSITANYSLIGNTTGNGITTAGNNIVNPSYLGLGALANNGGLTQTVALSSTSPATDSGEIVGSVYTDQRGVSRPAINPSIGAYQIASPAGSIVLDGVYGGYTSLQAAINAADASGLANPTIAITGQVVGGVTVGAFTNGTSGTLTLTAGYGGSITAPTSDAASISNNALIDDTTGVSLQLIGLDITGQAASLPASPFLNYGIYASGSTVTISNCSIHDIGSTAYQTGAVYGVYVTGGATLSMESSQVTAVGDELSSFGGIGVEIGAGSSATLVSDTIASYQADGIVVTGASTSASILSSTVTGLGSIYGDDNTYNSQIGVSILSGATSEINNSSITENSNVGISAATSGAIGLYNDVIDYNGGGLYMNESGTVTGANDAFSYNTLSNAFGGAGIWNNNGSGTVNLSNSTLSGNRAYYGGAILNYGTITLGNSTVSGNTAYNTGGGIYNAGVLTESNDSITGNTATTDANTYNGGTLNTPSATVSFNGNSSYGSLQAAINAAAASGLNLSLNPITVTGSWVGDDTIPAYTAGTTGTLTIVGGAGGTITAPTSDTGFLIQDTSGVSLALSNLTLNGAASTAGLTYGVYAAGSSTSVSISNSTIEDIGNTSSQTGAVFGVYVVNQATLTMTSSTVTSVGDSNWGGIAVEIGNSALSGNSAIGSATLQYDSINNYQADGIAISGANGGTPSSANISYTVVTGVGFTTNDSNGILVTNGATESINACDITGNHNSTSYTKTSFGISFFDEALATMTVQNSVIENNDADIFLSSNISPSTTTVNIVGDTLNDAVNNILQAQNDPGIGLGNFDNNSCTVNVIDSYVAGNQQGIIEEGSPTNIYGTTVANNSNENGVNSAGGIAEYGSGGGPPMISLSNDLVYGNTAQHGGGGLEVSYGFYSDPGVVVTDSQFTNNVALQSGGGGILFWGGGNLTLNNDVVANNTAVYGGGIANFGSAQSTGGGQYSVGTLSLTNCTLSGNSATQIGGGILNAAYNSTSSIRQVGTLSLSNCTLAGNTAGSSGGGIANGGTLTVSNSTLADNSAGIRGAGIINSTNTVYPSDWSHSPFLASTGTLTLNNSIVAANTATTGPDVDNNGGTTTSSYSLIGNNATSTITSSGNNIVNVSPGLGTLSFNGGTTETIPILATSPAAGTGEIVGSVTLDQRGVVRVPTSPDIGAYELIQVSTAAVNGDFISVSDLSEAGNTVTVTTDGFSGFTAGNKVVIAGETGTAAGYNGTWTIQSISGDIFTYTNSATGLPTLTFNANGYAISTNTSSSLRGSQRSMVDSVVYTFNAPVNLTSNAVTLALKGGITVTGPNTMATGVANVNWTSLSGGKIWVMTFSSASGNTVTGHSIADGVYTLSLNSADVTAVAGGSTMTTTRATDTFYRLYADTNGQQRVSNADLLAFNNCYAQEAPSESYLAALDYNADGRVNNTDLLAFNNHYSAHWTGFTSTI